MNIEGRDLEDYGKIYENHKFEYWQVKYRRKKVLDSISKYKPQKLLEIGCGKEPLFMYLDEIETVTVEPTEVFYNSAVKCAGTKDTVIKGYFEEVVSNQKWGGYFDYIVCSSLLHELDNPALILDRIRAIASSNTIVHINVPNANSIHRVLAQRMGLIDSIYTKSESQKRLQQLGEVYDLSKLRDLLENCGFDIVEAGSYFIKPFTHAQMQEMMEKQIITEKTLDALYDIVDLFPEYGSEIYVECHVK